MDPEIQKATELLLRLRSSEFRRTLGNGGGAEEPASAFAQSARSAALSDLFRHHCRRTLDDYLKLLDVFDALEGLEECRSLFEAHVDEAGAELLRQLGANGHAERNRVRNQSVAIKSEAFEAIEAQIERASRSRAKSGTQASSEPEELDDRLPLGRRGAFDRDLARAVEETRKSGSEMALVMIDVDHFKSVNDDHGHPVGDGVLLDIARLLVERTAHKGRAYRYGGEEFALLLPSYSTEEAVGMAERIRRDIEGAVVSDRKLRVTASFGVASLPDPAKDATALLEGADGALYEAKRSGRNRVCACGRDGSS